MLSVIFPFLFCSFIYLFLSIFQLLLYWNLHIVWFLNFWSSSYSSYNIINWFIIFYFIPSAYIPITNIFYWSVSCTEIMLRILFIYYSLIVLFFALIHTLRWVASIVLYTSYLLSILIGYFERQVFILLLYLSFASLLNCLYYFAQWKWHKIKSKTFYLIIIAYYKSLLILEVSFAIFFWSIRCSLSLFFIIVNH